MTINYQKIKNWPFEEVQQEYRWQDSALYALAIGYGQDPLLQSDMPYVYEGSAGGLQAVPTMAVVLAAPPFWPKDPESGIDWVRLLHGEQQLTIHKPLPSAGTVSCRNKILRVIDKGEGRGALLIQQRDLYEIGSGDLLASLQASTFCRGDGGFSALPDNGPAGGDPAWPPRQKVPERAADFHCELRSADNAALIYRLCADLNPLHVDLAIAQAAGFERPVLHGLASFGIAARAIIQQCCDGDASRLRSFGLRFSAPVYPGETLVTDIWQDGKRLQFQARVKERSVVALSHGTAEID